MLRIIGRLPKIGSAARRNVGTAAKELPTNADLPAPPGNNVIINGNFDIWQRGTTFTSPTGVYTADRWKWEESGPGVVDILRSTIVPDNTSDFSLQVDVTTAEISIAAANIYHVNYRLEGFDVMRFGFGTSDAKALTLSFRARSSKTGIHCVAFRNSANDRNYIVEYTIAVADNFENFSITLTADITGTWLTDSRLGLDIAWVLAAGTTFQGAANTWQAGNLQATSNQVNVMDNVANNFHISRVQLEPGSVATAFERRGLAQEVTLCERYYEKNYDLDVDPGTVTAVGAIRFRAVQTNHQHPVSFMTRKRAVPTMVLYGSAGSATGVWRDVSNSVDRATTADSPGEAGFHTETTVFVVAAAMAGYFTADAEL